MQGIAFYAAIALAVAGWAIAAVSYYLFRRWVALLTGGRVAIYYNRRCVLEAPLAEWATWAKSLEGDEWANGRTVYRGGKVSVVIVKTGVRPAPAKVEQVAA